MKKKIVILLLLCYCSINVYAQKGQKVDSIYYLLDTANTSVKDKIWDVQFEYPSLKTYTILCPCLAYDHNPTFVYRSDEIKKNILTIEEFRKLKLISLTNLIILVKKLSKPELKIVINFFIIEPTTNGYKINKVYLTKPSKPRTTSIDYENLYPENR